MIDATSEAMRLINALYNAGLEVCHQKSPITQASAARVLDDAGVREAVVALKLIAIVNQGCGGTLTYEEMAESAMRQANAALVALTRTREVNNE